MMIVPRVCYAWTPDGCWVTDNRLLSSNGVEPLFASAHDADHVSDPVVNSGMADLWTRSVEGALESVRSGEADKVVIARRAAVDGSEEMDVPGTLERLMDSEARCSVFSFGVGLDTFLGASPEPLVTLADGKLSAYAMRGRRLGVRRRSRTGSWARLCLTTRRSSGSTYSRQVRSSRL